MKKLLITLIALIFAASTPLSFGGRTPTITVVSSSGSVAAGAISVQFILSTNFTGTILGVAYSGATDAVQPLEAPHGDKLNAITYTVSAGSIRLVVVR